MKRLLISWHLSLIFNHPTLERENATELMKLADDIQQHVASLESLGVIVSPQTIVFVLESKLPRSAMARWEITLERDELPTPDKIYEFTYRASVCASKRERGKTTEKGRDERLPSDKRKPARNTNRAFLLNTSNVCPACQVKQHPLFMCEKFKQLSVPKRIAMVKTAKLCYNCMRSHRGEPCSFSTCTICKKRHNTLLHLETRKTTAGGETSTSETLPVPEVPDPEVSKS